MKCFKFLLLNGSDSLREMGNDDYKWNCMEVIACLGKWEILRVLEEMGIKKRLTNIEAYSLTYRNNLLEKMQNQDLKNLVITNENTEEMVSYMKSLKNSIKSDNYTAFKLLLSYGVDVNMNYITF